MNYLTVHIEGGLLSPDFLDGLPEATGQKPADFGLGKRDSLVDEVTAVWSDVATYWKAFQSRLARGSGESLTTITREQWVIPLLEALGYDLAFQRKAAEVDGRSFAISHRAGEDETAPPVHIVAFDQKLGDRPPSGRGRLSPHALLQDYLNRSDEHLWGIVTNGSVLRLLRDSTYFTRPAYIEFDLQALLEGERLDEFFLLYRLAQRNRLPYGEQQPEDCLLESYYQQTIDQGGRIRDGLRAAVAGAIITLANGFLRHPNNGDLREKLASGQLSAETFYQELLYLIYRLLFLMVAEERNLLDTGDSTYYRDYFSVSHLRTLADEPLSAPQRFDDLYLGWRTLCRAFHDEAMAERLGVPPLNGELFKELAELDNAWLNNRDFLSAVRQLSHFTDAEQRISRRVNYAALDVEELGSVYESLLDEQPLVTLEGNREPSFVFVSGTERKTTGSYYTPKELVSEVIKSALLPVINERLTAAGDDAAARERALLSLNICDPACGSGHFLLAAGRRIGYELARVRSGADEPAPEGVRAATREVITHCIYGVDKNPLAVDLCKVALWIEGHSRGKPLTFLDYRIRCGDSLVGVLDMDVLDEGIPDEAFKALSGDEKKLAASLRKQNIQERRGQMSLFGAAAVTEELPDAGQWQALENLPEDRPEEIAAKQAAYERLHGQAERAQTGADLWTAAFFQPITQENLPNIPTTDTLRRYRQGQAVSAQVVGAAQAMSEKLRFFHWELEFPHVFANGGFDAILGNPPWEILQLQEQEFFATRDPKIAQLPGSRRKKAIANLSDTNPTLHAKYKSAKRSSEATNQFIRVSERFILTARGKLNTYSLFSELARDLIGSSGRAGIIVPTGIATDSSTSRFFGDLVANGDIAELLGFENEEFIFPEVHNAFKFCILSMTGNAIPVKEIDMVFFCRSVLQLAEEERHFKLSAEDFERINPNTLTTPIFRTKADAELTKQIYRRVPVLENERTGENHWGISFKQGLFNMTSDSGLFLTEPAQNVLPLYEAKFLHQFDHRFSTYENATQADINAGRLPQTTAEQKADPNFAVRPRYWVPESEVNGRLKDWPRRWLLGFRRISANVNERTGIYCMLPQIGCGDSIFLMLPKNDTSPLITALFGSTNSLIFDYILRLKKAGTNTNFYIVKQLPFLPPESYNSEDLAYIVPRVLQLVYTSHHMAGFAEDVWEEADEGLRQAIRQWAAAAGGANTEKPYEQPFIWNDDRRARIRADLDAYYARLYGLTRDELRYILDPVDVYGPDFPGETFRVLKEKETKAYGEYRTGRLVLEAWDAQGAAFESGELPWEHDDPGPSVIGPDAAGPPVSPAASTPEAVSTPSPPQRKPKEKPTVEKRAAKPKQQSPAKAPQQLAISSVQLPDLSIASEGSFNQRLKRVQKLAKDPGVAEIAELAVFLTAPESSIRWFAGASLARTEDANAVAAIGALLQQDISDEAREEAQRTSVLLKGDGV